MITRNVVVRCSKCKIAEIMAKIEAVSERALTRAFLEKKKTVLCYECQSAVIHNNTPWSLEIVKTFQRYGGFMNEWRQRRVTVYQPPVDFIRDNPPSVVTVGENEKNKEFWICIEPYADYASRIEHADWRPYK